jgi:hypothetical protein
MSESIATHPVQTPWRPAHEKAFAPQIVTMKAYEVYCHVYAPQDAMVTGGCRGGFSAAELIAFLYASSFPKDQWRNRVDEAFKGMKNL